MLTPEIVNTDNIPTVEVKVTPFLRDVRTFINGAAGVTAVAMTIALALQNSLQGYAWFAPVLASINALNLLFGYLSKKNVASKNLRLPGT